MPRLVVGLTGGIGTGKSTALGVFGSLGAEAVSLDRVARELSMSGTEVFRRIRRSFGARFVGPDGELDRRALGELVFKKPALRRRLERLVHPAILREMRRRLRACRHPVAVVDVPLLFERGLQKNFDLTCVVSARPAEAARRAAGRDGLSRAQILRRMRAQMPIRRKEALADVVIRNDGTARELDKRIRELYPALELIARAQHRN